RRRGPEPPPPRGWPWWGGKNKTAPPRPAAGGRPEWCAPAPAGGRGPPRAPPPPRSKSARGALSCPLGRRARLRHHRLHDQSARARIDDPERAQRKQREHLDPRARFGGIVRGGGRARADEPLDQRAERRRRAQRAVLVGHASAVEPPSHELLRFPDD